MAAGQWTTHGLPASLRAEAARAALSRVHLPWSLELPDRAAYACRLDWQDLGGCTMIECRSAPLRGWRRSPEIRGTDGEHMGLLLVLSGRERVRQDDVAVTLDAGDLLLWDSSRPIDFEVASPLHKLTVLLPKDRLARACPRGGVDGARTLASGTGLGALIAAHVMALGRVASGIPACDRPLAADLVVDLLGRLMSPSGDGGAGGDIRARALRYIEAGLDDPGLTPSTIAASLGVTPRFLHMAFAATGRTLSNHIRERRLARIRRDLEDSRMAHLTITEIALRWEFADSAHASRSFRQAYGLAPSAVRARAQ